MVVVFVWALGPLLRNDEGQQTPPDPGESAKRALRDMQAVLAAIASRDRYGRALIDAGHGGITTEIAAAGAFYYAEPYHQQYLAKVPDGYCGLGGTGVSCPLPTGVSAA